MRDILTAAAGSATATGPAAAASTATSATMPEGAFPH